MRKPGLCHHAVSVCVSVSVTFMSCVKTNKHIFNFFLPSDSAATAARCCQHAAAEP